MYECQICGESYGRMPDGNDCEACGGHACVQMIDPDDDRPVIDRDDISEDIDW